MTQPDLQSLRRDAFAALTAANSLAALEAVRVRWLGRQGPLTDVLKSLKDLPIAERRTIGAAANVLRQDLEKAVTTRRSELLGADTAAPDLTMPGIQPNIGYSHPIRRMLSRLEKIFSGLGYEIASGPEVESERYNFDLLNVPKDHPARDVQDTFYLTTRGYVLRTHTSPVQIRAMESRKPPVRFFVPGRVYRHEATDANHEASFFQYEALVIDRGIRLTDLLGTLTHLFKTLFGSSVKVRFRPHFYPFTEPSLDADMSCLICGGKGCPTCGGQGWLEMLGSGMVHPTVLKNMGVDSSQYSGFAFGGGLDRLMMLYEGIGDVRLSYSGDLRFLERIRL
jgi:phenylalanyl-tRNA synthetase alpha chain